MTQPPTPPDEPLGGALTPEPEEPSAPTPPGPADDVPPPPLPPPTGQPAFPPPPPMAGQPGAYPPPPGAYPPPPGAYPAGPGAFPPAFPPGPGGYAMSAVKPHRGALVLGLALAGILCCAPLAFVAFFLGRADLAEMDAGRMDPSGRSTTNAGRIVGIVGMGLFLLQLGYLALNWGTLFPTV
ncbi:MAG: hypothetical protein MUD13_05255 [Candidatus Nanopelagicales bacterium]|jgi:hypothetical protein|nr:hypothetical protein [Candidatus Nanopelagicales bacterium]